MVDRMDASDHRVKVLYLGSNPRRTEWLKLDREFEEIKKGVDARGGRVPLEITARLAIRPEDLQPALHGTRPHILHFSGHATRSGGLILENDAAEPVIVSTEGVAAVARNATPHLRVIVLNACDSEPMARVLAEQVECAIGMRKRIGDDAAIKFSVAFYLGLRSGLSVQDAFRCGVNDLKLQSFPDEEVPQLFTRAGVDARRVVFTARPSARLGRGLALATALAGVGAVGACLPSDAQAPPQPIWIAEFSQEGGVVIASSRGRGAGEHPLCNDLRGIEGVPDLRCIATPPELDPPALLDAARAARASLVVLIDAHEKASVIPLGQLAGDDLLRGGLPPEDINHERSRRRLLPLLRAAARAATPELGFDPDPQFCPPIDDDPLDRIALLTMLLTPACARVQASPVRLLDALRLRCTGAADTDWPCALARYLYAQRWPGAPDIVPVLEALRDRAPERFRAPATLMLARRACEPGATAEARQEARAAAEQLAWHPAACVSMAASEIAACLITTAPPGAPANAQLTAIEALAAHGAAVCPAATRASILGRRAWWRARSGKWREALADYDAAFQLRKDPLYALNAAEAELQLGQEEQAYQRLRGIQGMAEQVRDRILEALLRWIAARQVAPSAAADEAERLLDEYSAYANEHATNPHARPPLDPGDAYLRRLTCPRPQAHGCAYDVLSRPSRASLRAELERSLRRDGD